jgi:hypothetical protein
MRTQAIVHAENGLIDLDGVAQPPDASPAPLMATGLIFIVMEPHLHISTGINRGPVLVDLEFLETAPLEDDDSEAWEDVAEFTAAHSAGDAVAVHGASEFTPEGASVAVGTSAFVRVRVSATGRLLAFDGVVREPCEHYLLQIWPVSDSKERVTSSISSTRLIPSRLDPLPPDSAVWVDTPQRIG